MNWLTTFALHPVTLISVGSAVGGNLRYYLSRWIDLQQWPGGLPWGTVVINVTGSFLLGLLAVILLEHFTAVRREVYLLLGTGFCGGYTTFSTFELETYNLIRDGRWQTALLNVLGSVLAGLIALAAGALLAYLLFGKR